MGVYEKRNDSIIWKEQHLYGSSRLGIWYPDTAVSEENRLKLNGLIGRRHYELSNHLGNVMAVISDKKVVEDAQSYYPEMIDVYDYYAFGAPRDFTKIDSILAGGRGYRYGFNGKENDDEVKGEGNQQDYGMRVYDPRLGRFLSVDPITSQYPMLTPYQFASNRPIDGIDLDGLEYVSKIQKFEYNGTWIDYVSAIDNGIIDILNIVPELWNSGVANYESIKRGTWTKDISNEFRALGSSIKQSAVNTWDYTIGTPIGQQFADSWNTLKDPRTLELGVSLAFGSKIRVPKVNTVINFVSRTGKSVSGIWVSESTAGWSASAIAYQEYVTGVRAGNAFKVNGVRFDGIRNNVLVEAKSSYDNFVGKNGEFYSWFKGRQSLLDQAERQIKAANGASIEWNFSSQKSLDATRKLFIDNNITEITLKYTPQQ